MAAPLAPQTAAAPSPPLRFSVSFCGTALECSNGLTWQFTVPETLWEALTVPVEVPGVNKKDLGYKHNQRLAFVGDRRLAAICSPVWDRRGHDMDDWQDKFRNGVGCNAYLAYMADRLGVTAMMRLGGDPSRRPSCPFSVHQKGDAMEALVGALSRDCDDRERELATKQLAYYLGVWYPEDAEEDVRFDEMLAEWRRDRVARGY